MKTGSTHILLIEDERHDARLIETYLRETGDDFTLTVESTLAAGFARLARPAAGIHLVLLDLGLPDSVGFATLEAFMAHYAAIPVIVLTTHQDDEMGRQAVAQGAQDFLDKMHLDGYLLRRAIHYAIERKHMLLRLEQAHELAHMGTWEWYPEGDTVKASAQLMRLLGQASGRLYHLADIMTYVHPEDQATVGRRLEQAARQGLDFRLDHRLLLDQETVRYVTLHGRTSRPAPGQPPQVICTMQDITDRRRMEDLTREKELAERSAKLRQEFLAKTSHEIRTPLNPILLLTDFLLKTELTTQQREHLRAIKNAGETLRALVNDILDLSKIEAGKVEFHNNRFSLREVLDSVREMMGLSAREKGLELLMHLDPRVPSVMTGDTMRLTQILMNLVGNAIKFTNRGFIRVSAELLQQTSERVAVRFAVSDSGIGIPQDKLQSIFDSFQQLDSSLTRRHDGTGLGLTIVRQLVLLQGGNITVESELGEGSTFTFELDFGPEAAAEAEVAPEAPIFSEAAYPDHLNGVQVLLVEDNPLNQMVTRKLLSTWGIDIDIANNGREGVEMLRAKLYDLVLMDIQMPEMDGYEATRFIRHEFAPPQRDVPILALTANAFSGSDDACFAAGMNDYVAKPIQIRELFAKIAQYTRPASLPEPEA